MKAAEVIEALQRSYSPRKGWVTVAEVRVGTGFTSGTELFRDHPEVAMAIDQRIDLYALNTWPSAGFERIAFEVKVSRSDFLHEVANPQKRAAATYLADRFVFATPKDLVRLDEVPEGCGLIEVDGRGCREVLKGNTTPAPLVLPFVASLLRVASEQRSLDRRCGFGGCMGSVRRYVRLGHTGTVPMCQEHYEKWLAARKDERRQRRVSDPEPAT